jgi:hypothetical protein
MEADSGLLGVSAPAPCKLLRLLPPPPAEGGGLGLACKEDGVTMDKPLAVAAAGVAADPVLLRPLTGVPEAEEDPVRSCGDDDGGAGEAATIPPAAACAAVTAPRCSDGKEEDAASPLSPAVWCARLLPLPPPPLLPLRPV